MAELRALIRAIRTRVEGPVLEAHAIDVGLRPQLPNSESLLDPPVARVPGAPTRMPARQTQSPRYVGRCEVILAWSLSGFARIQLPNCYFCSLISASASRNFRTSGASCCCLRA